MNIYSIYGSEEAVWWKKPLAGHFLRVLEWLLWSWPRILISFLIKDFVSLLFVISASQAI